MSPILITGDGAYLGWVGEEFFIDWNIDNIEVDLEPVEQIEVYMNLPSTTAAPFTPAKLQPVIGCGKYDLMSPYYLGSNGCRKVRNLEHRLVSEML